MLIEGLAEGWRGSGMDVDAESVEGWRGSGMDVVAGSVEGWKGSVEGLKDVD